MATEIIMPVLGMTMESGIIVEWMKEEGDSVTEGEVLFNVETDKSVMEVEAKASGTLLKILNGPGDDVPIQQVIGYIGEAGEVIAGAVDAGDPGDGDAATVGTSDGTANGTTGGEDAPAADGAADGTTGGADGAAAAGAAQALVDFHAAHHVAPSFPHQGHMGVQVVVIIEIAAFLLGVHHVYSDHLFSPLCFEIRKCRGQSKKFEEFLL